jgi:CheY-like chemotaxis protein
MPGASGIELVESMRETARLRRIPILLISGHDVGGQIAAVSRKRAVPFLRKPVPLDVLVDRIANLVRGERQGDGGAP